MPAAGTRVLENPYCEINSVDVSDWVRRSIERYNLSTVRKTAGMDTWESAYANKLSGTVTLEFKQSYTASTINATLWAALIARTAVSLELRPDDSAVSATNPKLTGNIFITDLGRGGTVEEEEGMELTVPWDGPVTLATS